MRTRITLAAVLASVGTAAWAADRGPAVWSEAKDFALVELNGGTVRLTELTKQGPVVLVVLRGNPGYQCPICSKQFAEYLTEAGKFREARAQVVFVYPGPADALRQRAVEFVKGRDYPTHFRLVTDPDYAFTTAYGLRWDARNETAYPSTFVIDRGGKVTFAKVGTTHGDRAVAQDVLAKLGGK